MMEIRNYHPGHTLRALVAIAGMLAPVMAHSQTVSFAGVQTTLLASGLSSPEGVAVDASGNVFVADSGHDAVKEIVAAGGYTTVNTLGSGFSSPEGVAVDASGNVFVADTGHNAVKEILAAGGYTTVNTLGSGFYAPYGVAVDGSGHVFVADTGNNAVKEILAAGGTSRSRPSAPDSTVPMAWRWTGPATSSSPIPATMPSRRSWRRAAHHRQHLRPRFSSPHGVAVDATGDVFVADTDNNAVKEILAAGGSPPSSPSAPGSTFRPAWRWTARGRLRRRLRQQPHRRIAASGRQLRQRQYRFQRQPDPEYNINANETLGTPAVLTLGAPNLDFTLASGSTCSGSVSSGSACIVNVDLFPQIRRSTQRRRTDCRCERQRTGDDLYSRHRRGGAGDLCEHHHRRRLPANRAIRAGRRIQLSPRRGGGRQRERLRRRFRQQRSEGDRGGGRHTTIKTLGSGFLDPAGVAVDGSGNVFVADTGNSAVKEIVAAGGYTTVNTLGTGFYAPYGVAVDGIGNVFVADTFTMR